MGKRKLIVGMLVFTLTLITFALLNTANAASLGKLTITKSRNVGNVTYKHQLYGSSENPKNIWKIARSKNNVIVTDKADPDYLKDVYCLRAGLGFVSDTTTVEGTTVEYNYSLPLSKKNIEETFNQLVQRYNSVTSEVTLFKNQNKDKFYSVLWLLDNMLLEDATEADMTEFLLDQTKGAGYTQEELDQAKLIISGQNIDVKRSVLTRADIEVIQQLAIWYFTNNDQSAYNQEALPTLWLYAEGDGPFDQFNTGKENGKDKYKTFADIYNLSFPQLPGGTIEIDGKPINIGEISGQWGTKKQNHAITLYRNLITGAKAAGKNVYTPKRDMTIYLAGTDFANQQPVIQVEESKGEADIVLRKFISAVNGIKIENNKNRVPDVDTGYFNTEVRGKLQTTAIYNHPKKPVSVKIGDTVTYTIRLYNEGEIDAYVEQVKDYLPTNLSRIIPQNKPETEVYWTPSEEDGERGYIYRTTENCKIVGAGGELNYEGLAGKKLSEVLIPAAKRNENISNGKDRYTLSYVDIEIDCVVMENAPYGEAITNIAEVTKMTDRDRRDLEDRDSDAGNVKVQPGSNLPNEQLNGPLSNYKEEELENNYVAGQQDDDDFDKVIVEKPIIDLALRKFIAKIGDKTYNRVPTVDTTGLRKGAETATYIHSKEPIEAYIGDVVKYKIRVYNEGEVDGKVTEITDYISSNLKYVPNPDKTGNDSNGDWWTSSTGNKAGHNKVVTTDKCKITGAGGKLTNAVIGKTLDEVIIPAYDKENDKISYIEVEIHCQIMPVKSTIKMTNIAEITKEEDENGRQVEKDKDSTPNNVKVPDEKDFPTYKDTEINKPYVPGQQDDDDFEKVVVPVPEVDIALRKFITEVDGNIKEGEEARVPKVNTNTLDTYKSTTAEYIHSKVPVGVKKGSEVVYTIRLYNEGDLNAYVSEVTDYLPSYLIYLPENEINKKYGWSYNQATREVKTTIIAEENTKGDEVYQDRKNGKLLEAYDGNGVLDYIDVQIVCKVDERVEGNTILTNLAQITEMKDEAGNIIEEDRDSKPDGDKAPNKDFEIPNDKDRPHYKEEEENKPYVPGQEDDDDFEKVLVKPDFDLALRKFVTQVQNTPINNRYPEVSYENGKISYKHTKDPVELATGNTVIYTIRVFNEGQADGYANEITDDLPEGLEFLPDHEINGENGYRWVMLDKDQNETKDVSKAKYIVTDYLSEEQEKETGRNNKIKAFQNTEAISPTQPLNPDYRDVKVAFKVTHVAKTVEDSKKILKNVAQISADSDDDIDSEPKRDTPYNPDGDNEDDIDYDNVRVKYFDLALLKWVSQAKITHKGGEEITIDTGHTAETSKNEAPVKIEIPEKELKTITIKYVYTIRVENQGEIEGYVKEVKDYIPAGLKFNEEDNKEWNWRVLENGVVVTDYLKDTLLKPGETTTVKIVLTWINDANNLGEKINLAEISKHKNDSDSPDVDSTPDNKVLGEDDIDDAPIILAVKTGGVKLYIGLIAIILTTFALGIGLIKRYVLE